ncbi:hypothetical protein CDL12_16011 [Handroanthus impetiginosus]|uniref:Uncharacterized protein n=1 Tax=Handroanthus impetiginosus TaxID=429701 RepID=A0A2G9H1J4_9LAMI|nr:hypothetical protein CDL12_16011 [Handroanthus impetiginosus]
MRGVGGPLLCISDLLSDVGEEHTGALHDQAPTPAAADVSNLPASDLPKLFQENFNELKRALEGADHSWTALTLKLCSALETANKLVDSTNSHVASLSEKVEELEQIVKGRDSAITAASDIQGCLKL